MEITNELTRYQMALVEVYEILKLSKKDEINKIPHSFLEFIKKNKSKEYKFKFNKEKNLNDQNLMKETKIILSLLYRSYICNIETRKELEKEDKQKLKRIIEENTKKYDSENLFKNAKKENLQEKSIYSNTSIMEYKETIFEQMWEENFLQITSLNAPVGVFL